MLQQVSTYNPTAMTTTKQYPMQGMAQQTVENIPVASKISDMGAERDKAMKSMAVLAGGAIIGRSIGQFIEPACGPNGPLVTLAEAVSKKTTGFDAWIQKSSLLGNIKKGLNSLKTKLFKPENVKAFSEGYAQNSYKGMAQATIQKLAETPAKLEAAKQALEAAKTAGKTAKELKVLEKAVKGLESTLESAVKATPAAQATIETVDKISKLGVLGKTTGKFGLWLKHNFSGVSGLLNGLFAAMTINNVIQAKKGEKFSTFMEDFFGTWIGSFGGYRIFEALLKGCTNVTKVGAQSGILSTVSKIVNKVPAKQFVIPLIGAMVLSTVLQKVSHAIFGKPTKNDPKVVDSVEGLQDWLGKTGWTAADFKAVKDSQPQAPVNNNTTPANNTTTANNNDYTGYMPSGEVPPTLTQAEDKIVADFDQKIDTTLRDIEKSLSQVGVKI